MNTNGSDQNRAVVDIGMRLVVETGSFEFVGVLMDEIGAIVSSALGRAGAKAEFDFTSVNTHPCKAQVMSDYAQPAMAYPALTQH